MIAIPFNALELPQVVAEAERRGMTVSEFIHSATIRAVASPLSRSERDEVIANLHSLNWSAAEIAIRIGVNRTTVRNRIAAMQGRTRRV